MLPLRALPCRALQLIGEYSKPITRGDWRTFTRITKDKYIIEIDKLYKFKNTSRLYKLVHTNMHLNIDMCLYDMTQEELDIFINYKDDNTNIAHYGMACFSIFIGILLGKLGIYFIDNQPTNNVILDRFIYVNILFGTLYSFYKVQYKLYQKLHSFWFR
jgi:hypothetical protein